RVAIGDGPVDDVRVRENVAQEAEAGDLGREAEFGWLHIHDVDFEQVARLGAFDVDRPRQGVDRVEVGRRDRGGGRRRGDLAIEGGEGLEHRALAGVHADPRWYV